MFPRLSKAMLAVCLVATGVAVTATPAHADGPGVDPPIVNLTLPPGGSATVHKTVRTPVVPPNPDLVFLADTTGSMAGAIANVRDNANAVMSAVSAAQPTAQFGVAEYKDEGDVFVFRLNQGLTADQSAAQAGIGQWVASGGGDTPEANLNALFQLATGAVAFRPGSSRIVAIFGDAPSHDPSNGHSLAATIAALQAAGVRVVAVNVGNLNAGGQAQAYTSATGGQFLDGVPADEVAAAILAGIQAIQVTVKPTLLACDAQLHLSFNPGSRLVTSGQAAEFDEGINVDPGAAAGTYHCQVDFLVDGESRGYIQTLTVVVPGLSVNDVTVNEGAGSATFTVTLSAAAPGPVTVDYATADGAATAPGDYTASSGSVSFAPGELTKSVSVPIVDDVVDEVTENFRVLLTNPTGAALLDQLGIGTIVDNDRNGVFSCSATALNLAGLKAAQANPADIPCRDDSATVAQVNLNAGLIVVNAKALTATTNLTPDNQSTPPSASDNALSTARIETTKIVVAGLVTIELGVIQSSAKASCSTGFTGASSIASLKINGLAITVGSAPLTVALPLGLGALKLNGTTTTGASIVQQAVLLDTLLTDLVLAESKANIEGTAAHPGGSPCVA